MRVVTLNVWGRRGAWFERRSLLVDGFREIQPDLVAFQEVISNDEYDQVSDLLDPGFNIFHQTGREADGQGVSIASRWPLGESFEVDLHVTPRTADFACGALVAEVLAPEAIGRLLFVNLKPNWQPGFECERELQAVTTARFVEKGEAFTFHELRHTAASFMIDEGADPLHVMRRMGHSDIRTTYNLYGHLFPDREDELISKLDRRHGRALEAQGGAEPELKGHSIRSALGSSTSEAIQESPQSWVRPPDQGKRSVDQRGFEPLTSPVRGRRHGNDRGKHR
ncbi:MAG: tyrosine-type recombinase/integrase [Actinomycetota bacterium]|nr:tyrosine-type recombinase/integrase [Actinomycetota bacterium]